MEMLACLNYILAQNIRRLRTRNTILRAYRASFGADSPASPEHRVLIMNQASSCSHSRVGRQDLPRNQLPSLQRWEGMAAAW